MRRSSPRVPIPPGLATRSFTIREAMDAGLREKRLRGRDLLAPFHGIRSVDQPTTVLELSRAFARGMPHDAAFSGRTAAQPMALPLPRRLEDPLPLEVAVPRDRRALRSAGVRGRSITLLAPPREIFGVPVVSPADLWVRIVAELSLVELVALGDQLIRRDRNWCDLATLADAIEVARCPRPKLRTALGLLDPAAESAPESELRVILVRAGITGFVANLDVVADGRRYRLDIGFPRDRVAIEYQGDYHRDPMQWRRDMSRRARLEAAGWIVLEINHDDLRDPDELIALVRSALRRAASVATRP